MRQAFDPDLPGTPESAWRTHPEAAAPELDLAAIGRLVVVAAHPDDESLGVGGTIAAARRRDISVTIVFITAGEASHPDSPTITPTQMSELRRAEGVQAARELGVTDVVQLAVPDGSVTDHETSLTTELVDLIGLSGDSAMVLAPWRDEPHPDHAAAGRAAHQAAWRTDARFVEYAVWAWHAMTPADLPWQRVRGVTLDRSEIRARTRAIVSYRSQMQAHSNHPSDGPVVTRHLLEHCERTRELLLEALPDDVPPTPFDEVHRLDDPWNARSRYESAKRRATLGVIPPARPLRVAEVGCSTGSLSMALARSGVDVIAIDESAVARERAQLRVKKASLESRVEVRPPPPVNPDDRSRDWGSVFREADLVLISEVGYYLSPRELTHLLLHAAAARCAVVACHWRHPIRGWPLDGPDVHQRIESVFGPPSRSIVRRHYLLGHWQRSR